jgi:multiple sugar transport system permease protein
MNIFPLVYNLRLGFTDARLTRPTYESVGGRNYGRVFDQAEYPEYARSLRTTAVFVVAAVSIELLLGFGLALCLRESFAGKTAMLTILLIPMMLSPAVMGLYWNLLLEGNYGIINQFLGFFFETQPQWRTASNLKLVSVLIVDVWMWTPFMMLIALAGLNAIPRYLYEAAEVDRAGAFTVFRRITLPLCAPLLGLAVLFRTTDALKQFDVVMTITGPSDPRTQTLSTLLYDVIFGSMQVGRGAAFATVVLVLVIAIATVFTRYIGRIQQRQEEAAP